MISLEDLRGLVFTPKSSNDVISYRILRDALMNELIKLIRQDEEEIINFINKNRPTHIVVSEFMFNRLLNRIKYNAEDAEEYEINFMGCRIFKGNYPKHYYTYKRTTFFYVYGDFCLDKNTNEYYELNSKLIYWLKEFLQIDLEDLK